MTNQEKYNTDKERGVAFREFCRKNRECDKCPAHRVLSDGYNYCTFTWLNLEAPLSADEAASILAEFNRWIPCTKPWPFKTDKLEQALDKAVEVLRSYGGQDNA